MRTKRRLCATALAHSLHSADWKKPGKIAKSPCVSRRIIRTHRRRWGDLHLARGEWAAAEARYRAALAQDDSPGWRLDLAVSLWGLGRLDEGWTEFETALEKADEDTRTETLKEYRRLLARHPALPGIAEAIERLTQAAQT